MKLTKELQAILDRYGVKMRQRDTVVTHAVYEGRKTDCDPLTFAVYEAAIKSCYLANALHPSWEEACAAGHGQHYACIAQKDGFTLPDLRAFANRTPEQRLKIAKQADADFRYCSRHIAEAGLYSGLLD